jgi:hypothetical protein
MGAPLLRLLLVVTAAGLVTGCQVEPAGQGADGRPMHATITAAGDTVWRADSHAGLTCSACHSGGRADLGRASVPRESCTASGCHEDGGAERVRMATATFEHRRHGEEGDIVPSCAGCHTHSEGNRPLRASFDACALCHLPQLTSPESQQCQVCHVQPRHVTLTSAGVPVPHGSMPWAEIGCVRCHYDVADPPIEVATERCASCHANVAEATRRGIGMDLHPPHSGVTCTSCHAAGAHQVRAVSSAVDLICTDCHAVAHEMRLAPWDQTGVAWENQDACNVCHAGVHHPQQQLLLGLIPGAPTAPARKFLIGMTCRSCHIPPVAGSPVQAIRGQALACRSCHEPEYDRVLQWWLEGVDRRLRATTAYVHAAQRGLGEAAPDSSRMLLSSAARVLALVDSAGGQHNLELTDRVFRESVVRVQDAYRIAGRTTPPAPALGRPPHQGLCSGCHYSGEPLDMRAMPRDFHERVVREQAER